MRRDWFTLEYTDAEGNRQRLAIKWDESIDQFTVTASRLQAEGNGPDSSVVWAIPRAEVKRLVLILDQG